MNIRKTILLGLLLLALPMFGKNQYTDALELTVVGKFLPTAHPCDRMDPAHGDHSAQADGGKGECQRR